MTQPLSARLNTLTACLIGRRWTNRAVLAVELGWTIRAVRDTASQSKGQILSGPKGLCLTVHASAEELEHSRLILLSQARSMIRRALELDAWRGTPAGQTAIDA